MAVHTCTGAHSIAKKYPKSDNVLSTWTYTKSDEHKLKVF